MGDYSAITSRALSGISPAATAQRFNHASTALGQSDVSGSYKRVIREYTRLHNTNLSGVMVPSPVGMNPHAKGWLEMGKAGSPVT
jgi:hypothetical protein